MRRGMLALALLAALALTSTAAAQDPPVDPAKPSAAQLRAQAKAYGDAALRLRSDFKVLGPSLKAKVSVAKPDFKCAEAVIVGSRHVKIPKDFFLLALLGAERGVAQVLLPSLRRFVARLDQAAAPDGILAAGADVWRAQARTFAVFARLKGSGCGLMRAWARAGFRASARPTALDALVDGFQALEGINPGVLGRAELRLLQLGVPSTAARAFGGDAEFNESSSSINRLAAR